MVLIVQIERGVMGQIPWAAVGVGSPIVVLSGLSPRTGVAGDRFVRAALAPVAKLTRRRRVFVLNRRRHLPDPLTMTEFATEHADALRSFFPEPVDVLGVSTGGSIAQQLAAEHPDTIRRLVLVSTACRLGPIGQRMQAAVAAELRAGRNRRAMALAAAEFVPRLAWIARGVGWSLGPRLVPDPIAAADLATTLEAEDRFDLARVGAVIRAPTLIIAGARDRFYSPDLFEETAALIPSARLQMSATKGHISVASDSRARAYIDGFLSWDSTPPGNRK